MDDIYDLLAKHFLGETNSSEEKKVKAYKDANPKEYSLLRRLWESEGIDIDEFDSHEAWEKFKVRIKKRKLGALQGYVNIRNIAASIAIFLLSLFGIIYLYNGFDFSNNRVIENYTSSPKKIELIDGSNIWLGSNSHISYPNDFIQENRSVELLGKAYFEVEKDTAHPFTVNTDLAKVTVLGTSFNINSSQSNMEINVRFGRVNVELENTNAMTELRENQSANITENDLINYETVNINYLSWMTGIFIFNDTPINQVITDLNTFYTDRIELDKTKKFSCNLTAKFEKADLEQIIEIIETTCNLKSSSSNNKYILR